jgi:hypothetical protein
LYYAVATGKADRSFTLAVMWTSLRKMISNKDLMVIAITYGLCNGMMAAWGSTLEINLQPFGYSQQTVGWIGFGSNMSSNLAGVLLGRVVDRYRKHKNILVFMTGMGSISAGIFALFVQGVIPATSEVAGNGGFILVMITSGACNIAINSIVPLFFDLAIEVSYPLPEGLVVMVLTVINNMGTMVLLFVPLGTYPVLFNWIFAGSIIFSFGLLLFSLKGVEKRFAVDTGATKLVAESDPLTDFSTGASNFLLAQNDDSTMPLFHHAKDEGEKVPRI